MYQTLDNNVGQALDNATQSFSFFHVYTHADESGSRLYFLN